MKRVGFVLACVAVSWVFVAEAMPASAAAKTKVQKMIEDLEMRRFKAMTDSDFATLEALLAADMTYSHSNGWTQTKAEFIGSLRNHELEYEEIKPDALQVRVYGSAAVVTGRAHVRAKSKGQEIAVELRFLDVYVKRQGKWQMVAWQSARLAM